MTILNILFNICIFNMFNKLARIAYFDKYDNIRIINIRIIYNVIHTYNVFKKLCLYTKSVDHKFHVFVQVTLIRTPSNV